MKLPGRWESARCESWSDNRKKLDGLESVPRLLFLWNRRPRISQLPTRDSMLVKGRGCNNGPDSSFIAVRGL